MAIKAIDILAPSWYTPKSEAESENPTRFEIKPLDALEYAEVYGHTATRDDGTILFTREGFYAALRFGVVNWENFADSKGQPIDFAKTNFRRIPMPLIQELVSEILDRSELGVQDQKNY
jgi:hypothetical protein